MTEEVDMDLQRKERIAKWIEERWRYGYDLGDTQQLLLEFWEFLDKCEAERQRQ